MKLRDEGAIVRARKSPGQQQIKEEGALAGCSLIPNTCLSSRGVRKELRKAGGGRRPGGPIGA